MNSTIAVTGHQPFAVSMVETQLSSKAFAENPVWKYSGPCGTSLGSDRPLFAEGISRRYCFRSIGKRSSAQRHIRSLPDCVPNQTGADENREDTKHAPRKTIRTRPRIKIETAWVTNHGHSQSVRRDTTKQRKRQHAFHALVAARSIFETPSTKP